MLRGLPATRVYFSSCTSRPRLGYTRETGKPAARVYQRPKKPRTRQLADPGRTPAEPESPGVIRIPDQISDKQKTRLTFGVSVWADFSRKPNVD